MKNGVLPHWILLILATIVIAAILPSASATPGKIKVVDDMEIALKDVSDDKIRIYDLKDGNLKETITINRDVERYDEIALGDVNGDGYSDIVIGDASNDKIMVYMLVDVSGNKKLVLVASRDVNFEREDHLMCGDVDGDGKDEIILGDSSKDEARIFRYMYTSTSPILSWVASIDIPHGIWSGDRLAIGDVNGDGKDEIIVADTDDNKIHIYKYIGGYGDNKGIEIKSFDVKFKINDKETIQYDTEDEIITGDVNGDDTDEIIYGNGYDTHRIYVYDMNGNILFDFYAYFDNADDVAAGDLNMDGLDEIIIGDANDGKLHVYGFDKDSGSFKESSSIDVEYEKNDGQFSVGDIDANSLVVEEVGRHRATVTNQIVAVINAPPKQMGINYDESDPYYTEFHIKYENTQQQSTSHTLKTVQDVGISAKLSSTFNIGFVKTKIEAGLSKSWKWQNYRANTIETIIAEGINITDKDTVIAMTMDLEIIEFKILKPDNMAVINGEQQYLFITRPLGQPKITTEELDSPEEYKVFKVPQIHTVGSLASYPTNKFQLTNYGTSNEIIEREWEVGEQPWYLYYSQLIKNVTERKFTTTLKTYLSTSTTGKFAGVSVTGSLRGDYGNMMVKTAKLVTTEQTDFKISYGGANFDASKKYHAVAVLYTDSKDGHLVLDWYVPSVGRYYRKPDLTIESIGLTTNPYCTICGCNVSYLIKNYGIATGPSQTYLYVDGRYVKSSEAPQLNPGESAWVTFNYKITGGVHTIRVCADGNNRIVEIVENNNCKEKKLECVTPIPRTPPPISKVRIIPKVR